MRRHFCKLLLFPFKLAIGMTQMIVTVRSLLLSLEFLLRSRNSFSLIEIWKETYRHGFLGNYANLRSDWDHRVPLHQNLLQQRTFYQSISPNFGYYCNHLLLDDVGNCISGTDEATHSTYTE
ncbi:hypothetical protein VNO77_43083 [Canavalia gladiata]|uniref:Uncharacterized protein n=1 Tax=Canavalia gladiata TaxID=3824 RepID=A0AAN9JWG1_CANGL